MLIKNFVVGFVNTNCYIVGYERTKEAAVIDPGFNDDEGKKILGGIKNNNLTIRYIINTHAHTDHTSGNKILKRETGAEIVIHKNDAPLLPEPWKGFLEMIKLQKITPCPACGSQSVNLKVFENKEKAVLKCNECGFSIDLLASPPADRTLEDGDIIEIGNYKFQVIHTPGHTSGSISLYCKEEKILFSGDTLFAGSIGRTDLPYSSAEEIMYSLKEKLMTLPDNTLVYPGHGDVTTIGKERKTNPYIHI